MKHHHHHHNLTKAIKQQSFFSVSLLSQFRSTNEKPHYFVHWSNTFVYLFISLSLLSHTKCVKFSERNCTSVEMLSTFLPCSFIFFLLSYNIKVVAIVVVVVAGSLQWFLLQARALCSIFLKCARALCAYLCIICFTARRSHSKVEPTARVSLSFSDRWFCSCSLPRNKVTNVLTGGKRNENWTKRRKKKTSPSTK